MPNRDSTAWLGRAYLVVLVVGALVIGLEHLLIDPQTRAMTVRLFAGPAYASRQMAAFAAEPWLIGIHAASGVLFTLLVPWQLSTRLRRERRLHRWAGYVFVVCAWTMAATGVAVSYAYPFAGRAGMIPNLLFGALLAFCTVAGVQNARRRRIDAHRAWMLRAAGIGLGIVLSRLYLPLLVQVFGLPADQAMAQVFWLGSGTNLVLVEWWLRRTSRRDASLGAAVAARS
jgi:uncharacterized membrane protein